MRISASIYANSRQNNLDILIQQLDVHDIDMIHVDCNETDAVFEDIEKIRSVSNTPIDLHIISTEPEKYLSRIEQWRIEYVSFQYENLHRFPVLPKKNSSTRFGLSITADTPVEVFEQVKDDYEFLMLMSTVPGKSGGTFNSKSFQDIIAFKQRFPNKQIHVDGGINDQIAYILRLLGVNAVVSGSYLMSHESLSAGLLSFHRSPDDNHHSYRIGEFMVPINYLPVIELQQLDFKSVIQLIEDYKYGFVLVTDTDGKLEGVITNADVRRGLLRHFNNLNEVNPFNLLNKNPVVIQEDNTVAGMLRLLNELNFIVLFLPVIDKNNMLRGAVLLNNLTRF